MSQPRICSKLPLVAFIICLAAQTFCSVAEGLFEPRSGEVFAEEITDSSWQAVNIPEGWKRQPSGSAAGEDGYVWFRCAVRIPKDWQGRDVELFVEGVDDAREALVNGRRVGGLGEFPPSFRSGLGGSQRFNVPAECVRIGELNVVAIRVYKNQGRTGFNVAAPVLFGGDEAIRLEGTWQVRAGDEATWATADGGLPSIAFEKREPAADVARSLKKLTDEAGPLSPAESLARFHVPDDLAIDLVLSEPEIGQPLSLKWDERGRLWVVEYRQYPNPAGLTMVSRDAFLRSVYDKIPPAPPHHFRGADKITIHEDTDGDGLLDKHKTFVDGLSLVTSMARGRGGVWVLNPPYLLFYRDADNDDVPDGDPEVHLEGFGIEDSHSLANNLRWGPDGWLYAAQGSTVTGNIRRPGVDEPPVHSLGQLIWRYHPESRRYEIFAEGGGNAFGVEFDAKGRIFSGHNGGDTRGFHYVQGGYYQKGFGKHGSLSNPYAFGYFPQMAHRSVPRFTHALVIYEGGALPDRYAGKLFGVGPLQSHVVSSEIEPDRSSFKTKDVGHPLTTSDTWFRPVDIQTGPDGAIYVADFYEQRIDHASHYQGRVDTDSGRIYRLRARSASPAVAFDYAKSSTAELVGLLSHKNKWHRQEALRLIADRRDEFVIPLLLDNLRGNTGQLALESLWALNLTGGLTEDIAVEMLDHNDPYVRLWTVRLLCDANTVAPRVATKLTALAATEPNVEARSQLACSARRLPAEQSLAIVRGLLARSEDTNDIHIPLLLWWAIEAKCDSDREAVIGLLRDAEVWNYDIVRDHILVRLMRRFAQAGTRQGLLTCAELLELAPSPADAKLLLAGFEQAFAGRMLADLPDELLAAIAKAGGGSLALQLRQSDPNAVDRALAIIADETASADKRVQFVQIFGQLRQPESVPVLLRLVESSTNDTVRQAALGALQSYDDPEIGAAVVRLYGRLSEDSLPVAQSLLASRGAWSLELLRAVDAGKITTDAVPLAVVRRILLHQDQAIAALIDKHWGQVQGATTEEMQLDIQRLASVLGSGSGNPYAGKKLFHQQCGKCHMLFDEGQFVGPDLTAYQRDDVRAMLANVVNPSLEIREGFENHAVLTADGRTLSGFIADQDNQVVVLRGIDGRSTVIPRREIDELRVVPQSIMPEGLLRSLNEQQVRDLFAYLRSTQPLP